MTANNNNMRFRLLRWMLLRVVCPSVCMSVCALSVNLCTLAAGQNEMPFGRNTHVIPSDILHVLDRGPGPPRQNLHCKVWPNH